MGTPATLLVFLLFFNVSRLFGTEYQMGTPAIHLVNILHLSPKSQKRGPFMTVCFLRMRWIAWFLELIHVEGSRSYMQLPSGASL